MVKNKEVFNPFIFIFFAFIFKCPNLRRKFKNKNYSKALEEILEKLGKDEEIIENTPVFYPILVKIQPRKLFLF